MNNKLNTLTSAILLGFANMAVSGQPPTAPRIYANGPVSNQLQNTGLSAAEKSAYALLEGVMEVTEGMIYSNSTDNCSSAVGTYTFDVFTNGAFGDPKNNEIRVNSPGGNTEPLILQANLNAKSESRGQNLRVEQLANGSLNGAEVTNFLSIVTYNPKGTLMTSESSVNVLGLNGQADTFRSKTIKDFYIGLGLGDPSIYDWGLQSLSTLDLPIENYWQRSQSLREDVGVTGRTVFVKDRLTGSSACRIVIDSSGSNNRDFFSQSGTLTISTETPKDPVPAFDAFAPDLSINNLLGELGGLIKIK